MTLTLAYITARKNPMIHWFFDSLHRECGGNYSGLKIVVVDFWAHDAHRKEDLSDCVDLIKYTDFLHAPPKPCLWQGPHRLTKVDYFSPSNARNTALCYAPDGWIVYVDDLSVLLPGWLAAVREAMKGGYVACGAYRKVFKLVVENGAVKSFEDNPSGLDHRVPSGSDTQAVPCAPQWLYGCSVAMPVEALLKINGWPELCDSTGIAGEDCHTGIALSNQGYTLKYDRRMMTFESEEHHFGDNHSFKRMNKHSLNWDGKDPDLNDKGHAVVKLFSRAKRFCNYFGNEGIAGLRKRILAGEPFPIPTQPTVDFYDGQPLTEL